MAAFLPFPPWPLVLSEEWAQLERPFSPSERKEMLTVGQKMQAKFMHFTTMYILLFSSMHYL